MQATEDNRDAIHSYAKRLQEARDLVKYGKQEEDLSRTKLTALMRPNSIEEFPDIVISSFVHERRGINQKRVRDEYPDVAEICTEVTTHTRIETHRRGGGGEKQAGTPSTPPTPSPGDKLDSPGYIEYLIQKHLPPTEEMIADTKDKKGK
jgi:hypothetical protein